jgi:hypothetical protein
VRIPRKTATLYALLTNTDFSDGCRVAAQADRLRSGLGIDPALLDNAFNRPLDEACTGIGELPTIMRRLGAPFVALSGAGPAHYTAAGDPTEAAEIARRLGERLDRAAAVFVVTPRPPRPL